MVVQRVRKGDPGSVTASPPLPTVLTDGGQGGPLPQGQGNVRDRLGPPCAGHAELAELLQYLPKGVTNKKKSHGRDL